MDCIFCKIVAGEIPSYTIAENEATFAFLDINPASYGLVLVIPKQHCRDIFDADPDDLAAVARMVQQIASTINATLQPDGLNIIQNNRPAAGQVVMHYHVHLIPRHEGDSVIRGWSHYPKETLDFEALATTLRGTKQA